MRQFRKLQYRTNNQNNSNVPNTSETLKSKIANTRNQKLVNAHVGNSSLERKMTSKIKSLKQKTKHRLTGQYPVSKQKVSKSTRAKLSSSIRGIQTDYRPKRKSSKSKRNRLDWSLRTPPKLAVKKKLNLKQQKLKLKKKNKKRMKKKKTGNQKAADSRIETESPMLTEGTRNNQEMEENIQDRARITENTENFEQIERRETNQQTEGSRRAGTRKRGKRYTIPAQNHKDQGLFQAGNLRSLGNINQR